MDETTRNLFSARPRLAFYSLAQLTLEGAWQLELLHERPHHLFLWITKGQGRVLLEGARHGVGVHNALFIPEGTPFALDLGRQGFGQALVIPPSLDLRWPRLPHHLRIRDVAALTEVTTLLETLHREHIAARALAHEACEALSGLLSVWLRRQLVHEDHQPIKRNAAQKLCERFCLTVAENFRSGLPMAEYAEALEVTPTHLSRACKASTGATAAELLTQRVLYEAQVVLSTQTVPVQDVARFLGFGSAAYFSRFIQQHTGLSPTKLRRHRSNAVLARQTA